MEMEFLITGIIEIKGNNILLQCGNNTKHWVTNCDVQFWGYKLISELPQSFCGNTLFEGKHYLATVNIDHKANNGILTLIIRNQ